MLTLLVAVQAAALLVGLGIAHAAVKWLAAAVRAELWRRRLPGPPCRALLGHASVLLSERAPHTLAAWANTYGPLYAMRVLNAPAVVLSDPAAAAALIRNSKAPDYVTKVPQIYAALELGTRPQLHNILTSADDAYWRAVRQGIAPCFSISNLKQVFPWILTLCDKAVRHVYASAAPSPHDVVDLSKRFTSDVMGHMLFNEDLHGMDMGSSEYLSIFSDLLEEVHKNFADPVRRFAAPFSADAARGAAALAKHDAIMSERLAALLAAPPPDYTIAGHLLRVKGPGGQPLSAGHLKAELAIIMGAGFETTSMAIAWTLAALAALPDVQQLLAAELHAAGMGPHGGADPQPRPPSRALDWSVLGGLPWLNAVIKESLRLWAPASMGTMRVAHKELRVLGHTLPKGCWVMMPPYVMGVNRAVYGATAAQFVPERWLDAAQVSALSALAQAAGCSRNVARMAVASATRDGQPPASNLPFSLGPRDCVGQTLAKIELQSFLASLVGWFNITPGEALAAALLAGAGGGGDAAAVLTSLGEFHTTLQARGSLMLRLAPRGEPAAA